MIQQEVSDYNKMCAKFLGGKYVRDEKLSYEPKGRWYIPSFPDAKQDYDLKFNSDWNWIMGVVEAIENLDLSKRGYSWEDEGITRHNNIGTIVEIEGRECIIYEWRELDPMHLYARCKGDTKLEATVRAINEFFIWYYKNSNDVHKL